uniref:Uncharacterized protein n=1 Tax=Mandrillus leucophaeus TaxID=9568 RepID=A0A2K5ZD81_MANLE
MWPAGLGRSLLAQPALCSFMGPQWILQFCSWLKPCQLRRIESCLGLCSFTTLVPLALDSSFMTVNVVPFVWTSSFFRAFHYPVTSLCRTKNTPLLIDGVTRIQATSQHEWQNVCWKPGILWGVSGALNKA